MIMNTVSTSASTKPSGRATQFLQGSNRKGGMEPAGRWAAGPAVGRKCQECPPQRQAVETL